MRGDIVYTNSLIENAIALFFTLTAQKPLEKIQWHERRAYEDSTKTLLVSKYIPVKGDGSDASDKKRRKVVTFDFVRAIIFLIY